MSIVTSAIIWSNFEAEEKSAHLAPGFILAMMEDEALSDDFKESLSLIMASSGLLLVLLNNMLDIRKIDTNSKLQDH